MKEEGFNEILLYTTSNGNVKVEIYLQNETVWLTQQKIADLFGVERSVVTKHLNNIFKTQELEENSVCAKIAHTASDGKIYSTKFYNLSSSIVNPMIICSFKRSVAQIRKTNPEKELLCI
jgi:hypothetical protein